MSAIRTIWTRKPSKSEFESFDSHYENGLNCGVGLNYGKLYLIEGWPKGLS